MNSWNVGSSSPGLQLPLAALMMAGPYPSMKPSSILVVDSSLFLRMRMSVFEFTMVHTCTVYDDADIIKI